MSKVLDALGEEIAECEERRRELAEEYRETGNENYAAEATRERGRLEGLREARDIVAQSEFAESTMQTDETQMIDAECGDCGTETEFAGEPTDRVGDSLRLHCPECGKSRSHTVTAARVVR